MSEMKNTVKFPSGFFTKVRQEAQPSKNPDDKIIPIKWSTKVENREKKAIVKKLNV